MVTVAIAGGNGHVGRTISDAIKADPKHNVIILARKAPETQDPDAPVFAVDYNDVSNLAQILKSNNVHTVISAIMLMAPNAAESEQNLVKAAAQAGTAKRFIPSEWGVKVPKDHPRQHPAASARFATQAELRKTNLEWTLINNGYFLDYYGMPYIETYMTPFPFVVDMQHRRAAIPGTGNEPMTFTYTKDLAKFVVAMLDLEKWEEETFLYGEKTTWNEFVRVAEEVLDVKFNVTYDSLEKLEKNEVTLLQDSDPDAYTFIPKEVVRMIISNFGVYVATGVFDMPDDKILNRLFPDIKPMSVRDMVSVWKGKV